MSYNIQCITVSNKDELIVALGCAIGHYNNTEIRLKNSALMYEIYGMGAKLYYRYQRVRILKLINRVKKLPPSVFE